MLGEGENEESKREAYKTEEYDKLRIQFQEYDELVELVCCIELWLEHNYGTDGVHGPRLIYFDRYPPSVANQGAYGPDFTVLFEDEYGLVGEVKRQVHPPNQGLERLVQQIWMYATTEFAFRVNSDEITPTTVPRRKDVLLIVSIENAVMAIERIEEARVRSNEFQLADDPVIIGHRPDTQRGPEECYWWNFTWHDLEGNCRFSKGNVMGTGASEHEGDLNRRFCGENYLPMRVELDKHGPHKVAVSFCSDEPPPIYALVNKVWPYITLDVAANLEEADKAKWHHENEMDTCVSVARMATVMKPRMPQGAVRGSWIAGALDLLVEIGWAERDSDAHYHLSFTKPQHIRQTQEYFMGRLAVRRAKRRLDQETPQLALNLKQHG